jgi:hypothetical protein
MFVAMVLSARFKNKRGLAVNTCARINQASYINPVWGLLSVYINLPAYQQLHANSMSTDFCTRPGIMHAEWPVYISQTSPLLKMR